jgi:uncharacterized protein YdcH (DUF465 family)
VGSSEVKYSGNMAPEDYEVALKLCEDDPEFNRLWEEHHGLKERLTEFKGKSFLTAEDEMEVKRIKRLKLWGKDKIAKKIRDYKVAVSPPG